MPCLVVPGIFPSYQFWSTCLITITLSPYTQRGTQVFHCDRALECTSHYSKSSGSLKVNAGKTFTPFSLSTYVRMWPHTVQCCLQLYIDGPTLDYLSKWQLHVSIRIEVVASYCLSDLSDVCRRRGTNWLQLLCGWHLLFLWVHWVKVHVEKQENQVIKREMHMIETVHINSTTHSPQHMTKGISQHAHGAPLHTNYCLSAGWCLLHHPS